MFAVCFNIINEPLNFIKIEIKLIYVLSMFDVLKKLMYPL